MKKLFYTLISATMCLASCNDNSGLFNLMLDTDQRIVRLEELCSELNTNITSLQVIVEAQQSGDYITNITPILKDGQQIGYTITFAKHPAITIYNGENGKDGVNGTNGQDGQTPVLGVAKDTDGIYYWTLDGSWLLDGDGHKIRVTGEKGDKGDAGATGATGATGSAGQNGTNGTNGTDGITPQLKIENDYWYISYDNGSTWTQLGKAKGDKGDTGATGMTGKDGNTVFTAVEYDDNFVYFTLVDGQTIKVSRFSANTEVDSLIVSGAIMYEFSVSPTQKVYFSQGNLQYNAALGSHLCADGTTKPGTWRFAEHQYDICLFNCQYASATCTEWQDLFAYGTSGYNGCNPYLFSGSLTPGYKYRDYCTTSIAGTNYDWGVYNAISNGGNQPNIWRTLTSDEVSYLMDTRKDAEILHFKAIVNGTKGYVFLPDTWSAFFFPDYSKFMHLTLPQWTSLESMGAVFLPAAGQYTGDPQLSYYWNTVETSAYWTSSEGNGINTAVMFACIGDCKSFIQSGSSVRLVKDVE